MNNIEIEELKEENRSLREENTQLRKLMKNVLSHAEYIKYAIDNIQLMN